MGLLAEIQNDAVTDATPVATLLRKVLVLASNLDSSVLEDWVRHELHGYPRGVEIPEYRRLEMSFKWSGRNPVCQVNGLVVASGVIRHVTGKEDIDFFKCRQAIGTIDAENLKAADAMAVGMQNYIPSLRKVIDKSFEIHDFWGEVPPSSVLGIIDAVRNRVLDFVLSLKKQYPTAGEVDGMTTKEEAVGNTVNHIFNTTINGNAGVVGNASHSSVNFTVNHGNLQDLRQQLTTHGIDAADVAELEAALVDEPVVAGDKKFGPKVAGWLGKMASKAASGAWNVGLEAGSSVLQRALLGYYGLS
ncbi:hypothetical protein [Rhizobium changzhiense]|uniref:AbiTii domain-containing protein n=1 Tax=Rhizobium changzhiense TaxID=2692317 RepID=A0ABR6ACR6_9HYPH|nr:hypothetical protein [Rhizobium changzhiense]MBA5804445.1 hypothetical protein [Rhizobium changzhiense]